MFTFLLLAFVVGGTSETPPKDRFDIGGFLGYSVRITQAEGQNISSLLIYSRLGYGLLDDLELYGFVGLSTLEPYQKVSPLTGRFGIGSKYSVLSKERNVNFNIDAQFEWLPLLEGMKPPFSDFPTAFEVRVVPTISFKAAHSFIYGGVGWSYFSFKKQNGVVDIPPGRIDRQMVIVIGIDYFLNPDTYLLAEMHSFAEDSIFLGVSYRF